MQTYVKDDVLVEVLRGDDLLDDLGLELLADSLSADGLVVLRGDDDGVDTKGNDCAALVLVLHGDLGLGVGAEPRDASVAASVRHGLVELVGEEVRQRVQLGGLVSGVAEHKTLVTSTEVLKSLVQVETLSDVGGLLLNGDEDVAGVVVEALGGRVVANVLDGVTDDLLVVEVGLCGDLTKDLDHAGLGSRLASNLGEGVLGQAGVQDGIGDLVANLVGVTLTDGLGLEEGDRKSANHVWCLALVHDADEERLTVKRKAPWLRGLVLVAAWPLTPLEAVIVNVEEGYR